MITNKFELSAIGFILTALFALFAIHEYDLIYVTIFNSLFFYGLYELFSVKIGGYKFKWVNLLSYIVGIIIAVVLFLIIFVF